MFLTSVLCRYKIKFIPKKLPRGHIFRGKYRLVRKVTGLDIASMTRHLEIEDRNMFYLRHPYLSAKEYQGVESSHVKSHEKKWKRRSDEQERRFLKHEGNFSLEKNFHGTLLNTDAWE